MKQITKEVSTLSRSISEEALSLVYFPCREYDSEMVYIVAALLLGVYRMAGHFWKVKFSERFAKMYWVKYLEV